MPSSTSNTLEVSTSDFEKILQSSFGISKFRTGQKEIITAALGKKDVLAVLPTGGGKSLCYQFPAVFSGQLVIVISPLIALMNDQVDALKQRGIPAGALHSGHSDSERRQIFFEMQSPGPYVLYLSPERAQKPGFQKWIQDRKIALFAVDEAHCVSQWGHDFREEYSQLSILKKIRPDVPVLALTASATPTVISDIAQQLKLKNPARMVHGFYRPNLYYQVEACSDDDIKLSYLLQSLKQFPHGRCLIYCGTRRVTEELAEHLSQVFAGVGFYHAGLSGDVRTETQRAYSEGQLRILVATNAFGMGIDRADVRLVVHYQIPANIDSLYQEMGRAGRDGAPSTCLTLYAPKDKGLQSYFIQSSEAPDEIKNLRWRNLDALINYCEGGECRHGEILTYYKDSQRIQSCGHCDSCDPSSDRKVQRVRLQVSPVQTKQTKIKLRKKSKSSALPIHLDETQESLFQSLRSWRKLKAQELDVPAFVVFSDKTLRQLASDVPLTMEDLRRVYGIGEAKLEKFGEELLSEIQQGISGKN